MAAHVACGAFPVQVLSSWVELASELFHHGQSALAAKSGGGMQRAMPAML